MVQRENRRQFDNRVERGVGNKDEQIILFNKLVKVEVKDLSLSDSLELGDVIDLKEMGSTKKQVDAVLKLR